jgi:acyl-CoA thioester hydrolase
MRMGHYNPCLQGEVSEWLKEPVSKTGIPAMVSRVRIPPSPYQQGKEKREKRNVDSRDMPLPSSTPPPPGVVPFPFPSSLFPALNPVTVRATVLWSDMDAYGHVNNAVFFRWFELARMEYLEQVGLLRSYERDKVGVILHSTSCRFRAPVFHPDTIEIETGASDIGDDRFTMSYVARSTAQKIVVGEGSAVVVCYDYNAQKKTALPKPIRERMTS